MGMANVGKRRCVCRLQHQKPTSDEVGMSNVGKRHCVCRLQHQKPTSDEVGMSNVGKRLASVGYSIRNPLLTKWVCRGSGCIAMCASELHASEM